jgi:hypothetical protein
MLKLVDGDGRLIGEFEDGSAVLGIAPNLTLYTYMPKYAPDEQTPRHIVLVDALGAFLMQRENVRTVMEYAATKRNRAYKGN